MKPYLERSESDEKLINNESSKELLKEASILVRDVVCRVDACHYHVLYPIVEKCCSQVNDSCVSIALHQSAGRESNSCDMDEVMSLPGIEDAFVISSQARKVCGRELLELHCPSALEFLAWLNPARGIHNKPKVCTVTIYMRSSHKTPFCSTEKR